MGLRPVRPVPRPGVIAHPEDLQRRHLRVGGVENPLTHTSADDARGKALDIIRKELAVMQPNGLCTPAAAGKIMGVDLSNPENLATLAPLGAHPAWQPVLGG